jgi:regulator of sigma E protease
MLITVLSFILVLGVLVFIHELGHFIVAKRVGIRVHRFSLGFPPYIFTKTIGETAYSIGLIPLGGFVKMAGENADEPSTGDPREFGSKSLGERALVIFAGPFMNYLLAIILLAGVFYFGGQPIFDKAKIIVGPVTRDYPAQQAGLQTGDIIVAIDGQPVKDYDSLRARINRHYAEPLTLAWTRGVDTMTASIQTRMDKYPNPQGGTDSVGVIGFGQQPIAYDEYSLWESSRRGFVSAHVIVWETVKFVKNVIVGQVSSKLIGGPIFIARQSGKEASKGLASLVFFMALLSVNLTVLNVLPIPILDGGHLLFLLIEWIRGEPPSPKVRMVAQQVGLIILVALIVFVSYNDVAREIRGQ